MLISLASCYPLRSFTSPAVVIGFFGWQRETDLWCKLMYTINQRTTHTRNKQLALRIHRSSTAENCCCYHEYKWTKHFLLSRCFCSRVIIFSSASSLQWMWQFADFLWSLFVVLWTFSSPPSVIFTRVSCWQQFVWGHHQPVVSLCVRMNSFSYSNSP